MSSFQQKIRPLSSALGVFFSAKNMAENLELDPLKKPMDTSLCEAKKKGTDLPLKDSFFETLKRGGLIGKKFFF